MKKNLYASVLVLVATAAAANAGVTPGAAINEGLSVPVVADLDGNGLSDLIQERSVLLNYGSGQFVSRDLGLPKTERIVDSLDLNGDGRPELLTETPDTAPPGQSSAARYRILRATAALAYGNAIEIKAGASPYIADANGDGRDDVILLEKVVDSGHVVASDLSVLLSRGDGTFETLAPVRILPNPQFGRYSRHLLAGDLDRDGRPDLVIRGVDDLVVLRGNGGGRFTAETRYLPSHPFGWWTTGLGDIDRDGNLDIVMAGFRSVRVLFGNGHGGFSRMASAYLPRVRSVAVPSWQEPFISDGSQAPRNFALGEFVTAGRTEIATGTAEGDLVVLACENGRLHEVARRATEFLLPDVHAGAFREPGRTDLYLTWNLGYAADRPVSRLFYVEPSAASQAISRPGGKSRAVRPASPPADSPFSVLIKASGPCLAVDAAPQTLSSNGVFGFARRGGDLLETVVDDEGTMYVRLAASWATSPVIGAFAPSDRGYEGSARADTACGSQVVSFTAQK
jgi:FG-GAP-like repeat